MTGITRNRVLAGRCSCCGAVELDNSDEWEPDAIAEGVLMCGWCFGRGHDAPDIVEVILREAVSG